MTNEEAICNLKKLKSFHNGSYGESIKMAIEALEKQIPKKPIFKVLTTWERIAYECNACHHKNVEDGKLFGDYCPYCGQKLDLGEENEI